MASTLDFGCPLPRILPPVFFTQLICHYSTFHSGAPSGKLFSTVKREDAPLHVEEWVLCQSLCPHQRTFWTHSMNIPKHLLMNNHKPFGKKLEWPGTARSRSKQCIWLICDSQSKHPEASSQQSLWLKKYTEVRYWTDRDGENQRCRLLEQKAEKECRANTSFMVQQRDELTGKEGEA